MLSYHCLKAGFHEHTRAQALAHRNNECCFHKYNDKNYFFVCAYDYFSEDSIRRRSVFISLMCFNKPYAYVQQKPQVTQDQYATVDTKCYEMTVNFILCMGNPL